MPSFGTETALVGRANSNGHPIGLAHTPLTIGRPPTPPGPVTLHPCLECRRWVRELVGHVCVGDDGYQAIPA